MPEVDDDGEVEIRDEDIRIDVYRSSGAGGRRSTDGDRHPHHALPDGHRRHLPERAQPAQNKEMAFKYLRSKLIEKQIEERMAAEAALKARPRRSSGVHRSAPMCSAPIPSSRTHRTGYEVGDVQAVMDGEIQGFIIDYLKKSDRTRFPSASQYFVELWQPSVTYSSKQGKLCPPLLCRGKALMPASPLPTNLLLRKIFAGAL